MKNIDQGSLSLFYDYQIRKDGKLLEKSDKLRCNSFVDNFIRYLYLRGAQPLPFELIDTSGATKTSDASDNYVSMDINVEGAGAGTDSFGIQVGTGTTAVAIDDYSLETPINDGNSTGELEYSDMSIGAPATDASGTSARFTRVFDNNSGGNITIEEIGMVAQAGFDGTFYYLIIRDVLGGSAITVNNGEELTLNYTLQTTVS